MKIFVWIPSLIDTKSISLSKGHTTSLFNVMKNKPKANFLLCYFYQRDRQNLNLRPLSTLRREIPLNEQRIHIIQVFSLIIRKLAHSHYICIAMKLDL